MKSDEQSTDMRQKYELFEQIEQKMNATMHIDDSNTGMNSACRNHMENMPEGVATCVERFLIGNVV